MLTIHTAKNLHGKFELPPDINLFFLAAVTAICRRIPVSISPAPEAPVIDAWKAVFSGHGTFVRNDDALGIHPVIDDPSLMISFDTPHLPWRDLTVFALLGMRKTVVFKRIDEKRIIAWRQQLARFGCRLEAAPWEQSMCLSIEGDIAIPDDPDLDETDLDGFSGLLLGTQSARSFPATTAFLSPLRSLASLLQYTLDVKSAVPRERDPLARRIQFMQNKNRRQSSGTQQFTVVADFSPVATPPAEPVSLTLPGDALLGTVFTAAKCLYPKSSFVIGNMPLESWASPVFPLIRKMGGKVSVQETGRTSFGSTGIVHVQSGDLVGRKCECRPSGRFVTSLPSMVVIASFAKGESVFRDLDDLRCDTPDGIDELESCIRTLGARHGEMPDGIVLQGGSDFDGFDLSQPHSPAIAAVFAVAATRCSGDSTVNDETLTAFYPSFPSYLEQFFEYRTSNEKN